MNFVFNLTKTQNGTLGTRIQESCIINADSTTKYLNLEKCARQSDPISAYLFIIAFEVLFILIKNKSDIKGINTIDHVFLCTSYSDNLPFFFLKVQSSKLYNTNYMIASTQITNTEISAFIAVLVFKLLSRKVLFIDRKDNRNCKK